MERVIRTRASSAAAGETSGTPFTPIPPVSGDGQGDRPRTIAGSGYQRLADVPDDVERAGHQDDVVGAAGEAHRPLDRGDRLRLAQQRPGEPGGADGLDHGRRGQTRFAQDARRGGHDRLDVRQEQRHHLGVRLRLHRPDDQDAPGPGRPRQEQIEVRRQRPDLLRVVRAVEDDPRLAGPCRHRLEAAGQPRPRQTPDDRLRRDDEAALRQEADCRHGRRRVRRLVAAGRRRQLRRTGAALSPAGAVRSDLEHLERLAGDDALQGRADAFGLLNEQGQRRRVGHRRDRRGARS